MRRAKEQGQSFTITMDDITIPTHCPILGIELEKGQAARIKETSSSLDRIDNDKGYVPGNVWVISQRANRMKGNHTVMSLRHFADVVEARLAPVSS